MAPWVRYKRKNSIVPEEASRLLKNAPGPAEGILPEALQALPEAALLALDESLVAAIGQLRIRDDRLAERPLSGLQQIRQIAWHAMQSENIQCGFALHRLMQHPG